MKKKYKIRFEGIDELRRLLFVLLDTHKFVLSDSRFKTACEAESEYSLRRTGRRFGGLQYNRWCWIITGHGECLNQIDASVPDWQEINSYKEVSLEEFLKLTR